MILAELGRPCLLVPTNQSWVDFFSADAPLFSTQNLGCYQFLFFLFSNLRKLGDAPLKQFYSIDT